MLDINFGVKNFNQICKQFYQDLNYFSFNGLNCLLASLFYYIFQNINKLYISGPSSKNQAAFLLQVLMDFKNEIDFEVERKDIPNTSIPIEIYNSDYEMVNFPAQSLQSIKKFEQKINTIWEYVRTLQKVYKSLNILIVYSYDRVYFCAQNVFNSLICPH